MPYSWQLTKVGHCQCILSDYVRKWVFHTISSQIKAKRRRNIGNRKTRWLFRTEHWPFLLAVKVNTRINRWNILRHSTWEAGTIEKEDYGQNYIHIFIKLTTVATSISNKIMRFVLRTLSHCPKLYEQCTYHSVIFYRETSFSVSCWCHTVSCVISHFATTGATSRSAFTSINNFGNYAPVSTAQHRRRLDSSVTPLQEPQISQSRAYFDVNTSLNSVRCRGVSTKNLATKRMARFVALISRKL
jgi:hypothetical protein